MNRSNVREKAIHFLQSFNLFPSIPPSIDRHDLQTQRLSTRVFILLFITAVTVLILYTSLIDVQKTIVITEPTLAQYSELYESHSSSLTCPCTQISIDYGKFIHIDYTLHQVCNSIFVTDTWISYWLPSTNSNAFELLNMFCQSIRSTISNSFIQFNSTQYITAALAPVHVFQTQVQSFFDQFESTTTKNFLLSLNLIRNTTQANHLVSGLATNVRFGLSDGVTVSSDARWYGNCDCSLSSTCIAQSQFYLTDRNLNMTVPGFYTGCFVVESLLQSNLQCFYNQSCLDALLSPSLNTTALNLTLLSQYSETSTISELFGNLMIEEWSVTSKYDAYYNECQPKECRYVVTARNSAIYVVTTLIGIVGGLTTVLTVVVPRMVNFLRKKKRSTPEDVERPWRESIRHLFPKVKRYCTMFNLFPSIPPSTDRHDLQTQRLSTRVFIVLFITAVTVLILYTSLIDVQKTIVISEPTLAQYLELYESHSSSLTCPCTQISIDYGKFIHIDYTLHQVCNSIFVTDSWITYVKGTGPYFNIDFQVTGKYAFGALRGFCELIENTITNNLARFNATRYITAALSSLALFRSHTQAFVNETRTSTTNSFLLALTLVRNTTQANVLYSALRTYHLMYIPNGFTEIVTAEFRYPDCRCSESAACIAQASIYSFPSVEILANVSGFYYGCYVIEALLRSNLACFYNQTCIDQLRLYLSPRFAVDVKSLQTSSPSQYATTSTIHDLINNLMLEEWEGIGDYEKYYDECKPSECRFINDEKNSMIYLITALIGVVGGLTTALRFSVPRFVKFIRKKREDPQPMMRVLTKRMRALLSYDTFKRSLKNFNLFPSIPPSTDEYEVEVQRISTRLFMTLFISVVMNLFFYTSLIVVQRTMSFADPTLIDYTQLLYPIHAKSLACPCTQISIEYGKFVDINYTLHDVCSSVFIASNWSLFSARFNGGIFYSSDIRVAGVYWFQALNGFCQLIQNMMSNSLMQFRSTRYVTASLTPQLLFQSHAQSFIDEFRLSTTNSFLSLLDLVRNTTQANRLFSATGTNYHLLRQSGTNEIVIRGTLYGNCDCDRTPTCMVPSSIYQTIGTIDTSVFTVPGLYSGCLLIESLLQSNLQCFYNQACIDELQGYLSSPSSTDQMIPNALVSDQYSETSTINELLGNLMIEDWSVASRYDAYYNECRPKKCRYVVSARNSAIYVITTLIGIVGGLTTVLKLIVPRVVKLIIYCIRRWKARSAVAISTIDT